MYLATTPVLSIERANDLGLFLARYEIHVTGLQVFHITEDGRRVKDDPTADAIKNTAESGAASAIGSEVAVAAGISFVLPPAALLAAIAAIPPLLKKQNDLRKKQAGGSAGSKAVSSEVGFDLADVSARRRKWAEWLLSVYAARHDWQLRGLHHPEQLALGARYAATHAGDPPPWGDRDGAGQWQPPAWAGGGRRADPPRDEHPQRKRGARGLLRDLW